MKRNLLTTVLALLSIATVANAQVDTLQGAITSNKTLSANTIHILKGFVYVKNNATLTIEPGTIIKGDKATTGTLIITRGSKLVAVGTPALPIVFTSDKPAGQRAYGDWGGVILLGNATTNQATTTTIEGLDVTNADNQYGGTNDADSSGALKYVRIEFCGVPLQPNKEINGLTFGGVGSKTFVDRVQVSYSGDDSYEFFGGTVNAKHLFSFRTTDDNFDFDFGYRGKIQYGVSLIDPAVADAAGKSNGIECDNEGTGDVTKTPFTNPILEGFTIVGNGSTSGSSFIGTATHFRRVTKFSLRNSVVIGYKNGIYLESDSTANYLSKKRGSFYQNNLIFGSKPYYVKTSATTADSSLFRAYTADAANADTLMASNNDAGLVDPFNLTAPNFMPKSTTARPFGGADYTNADNFFDKRTYRGAFGTINWLAEGWSNFDPQNADYSKPLSGINNNPAVSNLSIYPNPAQNSVRVNFGIASAKNVTFNVVNLQGQVVASQTANYGAGFSTATINTENLSNGMYFVQILSNEGASVVKVQIAK